MQYAQIIVNHKASYDALTYAIPAEVLGHVAIGSVVRVPVGKTLCHGVIQRFVRRVEPSLAPKLKPIHSIVYPGESIPNYILAATQAMQEQWGYHLSDVLFPFLPPLPKRSHTALAHTLTPSKGYSVYECLVPMHNRARFYEQLLARCSPRKQSLLVVCPSHRAASSLKRALKTSPTLLYPYDPGDKAKREFYTKALSMTTPTIIIGTRGTLFTPLDHIGAIVIDEPWLPGHKEDNTPKLWSIFAAEALCKARRIPLYAVTSIPWPETRTLNGLRRYNSPETLGILEVTPKRPLAETVTHFLAENDESGRTLLILIHETHREVLWCDKCRKIMTQTTCPTCRLEAVIIPRLSVEEVTKQVATHETEATITIVSSDDILTYHHYDAILVLNFDAYLSVTDFRSTCYLATLLHLIRSQSTTSSFVTARPEEWVGLLQKDREYFQTVEIQLRKRHLLPPFSIPVHLLSDQREALEKLLPLESPDILRIGSVRRTGAKATLSLLLKPGTTIPASLHRNRFIKVDVFPHYIE